MHKAAKKITNSSEQNVNDLETVLSTSREENRDHFTDTTTDEWISLLFSQT